VRGALWLDYVNGKHHSEKNQCEEKESENGGDWRAAPGQCWRDNADCIHGLVPEGKPVLA
jgi:hypothetical protein